LRAKRSNPSRHEKKEWICFVASAPRNDGEVVGRTGNEKGSLKMTGAETLDVARDAIWTIVVVSSPLMVVGLVVGVVVSLFQALTQIQEQTLVFVPKILAIFVTLLLALPFMADSLHGYMMRISSRIIGG
jgi:flagellar biosynthetic protein FliQ